MEEESDERLLARIQTGDRRAFSILVRRHSQRFYRMAWRMSGRPEDAEEIVQEAFLKLWDRPDRWTPGKGAAFTTWFSRIVMNISIDRGRRDKAARKFVGRYVESEADDATPRVAFTAEQAAIERVLQTLPSRQRAAINLCFYEEATNREAAAILGVGVKALESLLMRAKASLRAELAKEGIDV